MPPMILFAIGFGVTIVTGVAALMIGLSERDDD